MGTRPPVGPGQFIRVQAALERCEARKRPGSGAAANSAPCPAGGPEALADSALPDMSSHTDEDGSPILCACLELRRDTLKRAILQQDLRTAAEVGAVLKVGRNCAACHSALRGLLRETQ